MKKTKQIEWILPLIFSLISVAGIFALLELEKPAGIFACCVSIVIVWAPYLVTRFTPIRVPTILQVLIVIHAFLGACLGSGLDFFYTISFWDILLHTWSGFLCCLASLWILSVLKEKMGIFGTIVFAVAFSSMIGMCWEIYEFCADSIVTGSNMQKFMTEDGIAFIGRAALADTMEDMICNFVGSIVFAIAYILDYYFNKSKIITVIEKDFSN